MGLCKTCGIDAGYRKRYCEPHRRTARLGHWRRHDKAARPHHGRDRHRLKRKMRLERVTDACEVCQTTFGTERATTPCWDHDHATGQFRGWLCHRCNVSLGLMADSPARLRAAANYVEARRG